MKKTYISPETTVVSTAMAQMVCQSGVTSEERDIYYGGVDEEGTKEPGARRRRRNQWDDEDDGDENAF